MIHISTASRTMVGANSKVCICCQKKWPWQGQACSPGADACHISSFACGCLDTRRTFPPWVTGALIQFISRALHAGSGSSVRIRNIIVSILCIIFRFSFPPLTFPSVFLLVYRSQHYSCTQDFNTIVHSICLYSNNTNLTLVGRAFFSV